MTTDRHYPAWRLMGVAWFAVLVPPLAGCGGTGGAWLWWLTDPEQKVEAEHRLDKGRLAILIDDDHGWLKDPAIRPLLSESLVKALDENEVTSRVIPDERVVRLRARDPQFDRRGAREIGERLKADQVLHLNVRSFELHHEVADPVFRGNFVVAVKVLDVHATQPEDVRLWPQSSEGRLVEVTTDLHTGKGTRYHDDLTRRLCEEMADKIAKLFYVHTVPKRL